MKEQVIGRPTLYNEDMLQRAQEYVEQFNSSVVDKESDSIKLEVIPSVAGLSLHLGVSRTTIYDWAKDEDKKAFSNTLERLNALQEAALINGGLQGRFNANIAKLALANHNYSDKVQTDMTSSDGSMSPARTVRELSDEELERIASESE